MRQGAARVRRGGACGIEPRGVGHYVVERMAGEGEAHGVALDAEILRKSVRLKILGGEAGEGRLVLNPDAGNAGHTRRQAQQSRPGARACLQNQLTCMGRYRCGQQHRLEPRAVAGGKLPVGHAAA